MNREHRAVPSRRRLMAATAAAVAALPLVILSVLLGGSTARLTFLVVPVAVLVVLVQKLRRMPPS